MTVHVAGRRLIDEVRSGGSFCSQNDLRIHVGLGARRRADRIEVAWPSGAVDTVAGVDADQMVVIREGSGAIVEPFSRRVLADVAPAFRPAVAGWLKAGRFQAGLKASTTGSTASPGSG